MSIFFPQKTPTMTLFANGKGLINIYALRDELAYQMTSPKFQLLFFT